jgi:hypothetical protein
MKFEALASPRVFQVLLGKCCICQLLKKDMSSKKRVYLQQFDIIHLSNSDLTYIRNLRETKLSLSPSTFWKLTSETLLCCLFFSTLHLFRSDDAKRAPHTYIYVLEAGFFPSCPKWPNLLSNSWKSIFYRFCKTSKMATRFGKLLEMFY